MKLNQLQLTGNTMRLDMEIICKILMIAIMKKKTNNTKQQWICVAVKTVANCAYVAIAMPRPRCGRQLAIVWITCAVCQTWASGHSTTDADGHFSGPEEYRRHRFGTYATTVAAPNKKGNSKKQKIFIICIWRESTIAKTNNAHILIEQNKELPQHAGIMPFTTTILRLLDSLQWPMRKRASARDAATNFFFCVQCLLLFLHVAIVQAPHNKIHLPVRCVYVFVCS